jgi:hypothetical protein
MSFPHPSHHHYADVGPQHAGAIKNVMKRFKKEKPMKVETIIIKEFQEIVDELTEVLSQLGARFVVDEFFPM